MSLTDRVIQEGYHPKHFPGINHVGLAEFIRDMRRLDDLRNQYQSEGLNSFESSERDELLEKYGMSHTEWWQEEYHMAD